MGLFSDLIPGAKMFSSFMHPERGYKKGQEQFDKYYNQSQNYLQPYNNQGQQAYGHLNTAMQNLLNPSQMHDQWLNNYQQSDASRFAQERARQSGMGAASSMGLMGSTPALQAIQAGTNQIGAEDEQRYIERMIQQYMQGAQLAQGIYGQGAQTAGAMSNNANQMGTNSAEMAYGRQNAPGQQFGNLLGTASTIAGGTNGWSTQGGR